MLTSKQTLQRLPIALAQVKAGNNLNKFIKWNQINCLFFGSVQRYLLKKYTITLLSLYKDGDYIYKLRKQ